MTLFLSLDSFWLRGSLVVLFCPYIIVSVFYWKLWKPIALKKYNQGIGDIHGK
jgi:hypothetical protein